jgi:hypothetical protein
MQARKNSVKKGILMSLLVIVLLVLMLGEVMTYVIINVDYSLIAQSASLSSIQGTQAATIKLSMASFLHSSLSAAVSTLATYEGTPSLRKTTFVNNTQYALTSLMMNGTLYGANLTSYMGNLTIANFNNSLETQFTSEGLSLSLGPGANLTVFQSGPSAINATYSVLATVNAVSSSYTTPITVTTGMQLNGSSDLSALLRVAPSQISISQNLSRAVALGGANSIAIAGSTGPFMFAYGTEVYKPGEYKCSNIPTGSANMILVIFNGLEIPLNGCGYGGVITATPNAVGYDVPYLVYSSTSPLQATTNGTQILLNGPGLSMYSLAPLQSAIQNNEYFASPYLPNYLNSAQGALAGQGSGGLFSFGLDNRAAPDFSASLYGGSSHGVCTIIGGTQHCYGGSNAISAAANIVVAAGSIVLPPTFTVAFWIDPYNSVATHSQVIGEPSNTEFDINVQTASTFGVFGGQSDLLELDYRDIGGTLHSSVYNTMIPLPPNTWSQVALVFGVDTVTWYINGERATAYTGIINPATNANAFVMGGSSLAFNGMLSDVQVYNAPLSPFQVQELYRGGISGWPPVGASLLAWYPLNGNGNDYSGFARNGTQNYIYYAPLNNYYGDPVYQNALTNFNTSEVEGVLNCGNINQCTQSAPHLFVGRLPLETSGSSVVNESAAFNLGNALIPDVLMFNPGPSLGGSYVQEYSPVSWLASNTQAYSVSIWVYPTMSNGIILDEYNSSGGIHDPWISIESGTGYIGYEGSSLQCSSIGSIPLNTWSDITLTFSGSGRALNGYVDGVSTFSGTTQARSALTYNPFYDLGKADSSACGGGPGLAFDGFMSDFQVYNTVLSAAQVTDLYMNDSVNVAPTVAPSLAMRLGVPYGNINSTPESVSNNYGVFYLSNGEPCSQTFVLDGYCGLGLTPP